MTRFSYLLRYMSVAVPLAALMTILFAGLFAYLGGRGDMEVTLSAFKTLCLAFGSGLTFALVAFGFKILGAIDVNHGGGFGGGGSSYNTTTGELMTSDTLDASGHPYGTK